MKEGKKKRNKEGRKKMKEKVGKEMNEGKERRKNECRKWKGVQGRNISIIRKTPTKAGRLLRENQAVHAGRSKGKGQ